MQRGLAAVVAQGAAQQVTQHRPHAVAENCVRGIELRFDAVENVIRHGVDIGQQGFIQAHPMPR